MKVNIMQERVFNYAADKIWPIISDTATLNRRMGLAPMSFQNIAGVRYGHQKMLGLSITWTEEPWEWKHQHWLRNKRIYSKGFFKSIEGFFQINEIKENQCNVSISFTLEHKYRLFAGFLNKATTNVITKLLNELEKSLLEKKDVPQKILPTVDSFQQWLINASAIERARISPKSVARDINSTWVNVFTDALSDKYQSRFSLKFDAICPHCRGAKKSYPRLTEMPQSASCETCEINFPIGTQESIEVSLRDTTLSPEQAATDFCSADVIHHPTIIYQRFGGRWSDTLDLETGLYSLKRKGFPHAVKIVVQEDSNNSQLELDHIWRDQAIDSAPISLTKKVTFKSLDLPHQDLIMLEKLNLDRGVLTATEVMLDRTLEHLIPAESLITDFPIEMGKRTLLFTDVVGSTDLYHEIGDNNAFKLVRESFLLIGNVTKKHGGHLVKTIGDATMYAFSSTEEALRAAIEIQQQNRDGRLKLRISLHSGQCLCVSTKDGLDFFGDAVNICAKFQSEADADEIVFENHLRSDLSHEYWKGLQAQAITIPFTLKGKYLREFELLKIKI